MDHVRVVAVAAVAFAMVASSSITVSSKLRIRCRKSRTSVWFFRPSNRPGNPPTIAHRRRHVSAGLCTMARIWLGVALIALAAATAPVAECTAPAGAPCLASSIVACASGCCHNGTCAAWDSCFAARVPGSDGAPCTASDPGQCATGCCVGGACAAASACYGTDPSTMFVQSASGAVISIKDFRAAWPFTVELTGANAKTTWFTDRPVRSAGRVTNDKFLGTIGDTTNNPLNAVLLAAINGSSRDQMIVVQLANGRANGTTIKYESRMLRSIDRHPPSSKIAKFRTELITNVAKTGTELYLDFGPNRRLNLTNVELFIDDCPSNVPFYCCTGAACQYNGYEFPQSMDDTYGLSDDAPYFACPTNAIGVVVSNACWYGSGPSSSQDGTGCVACNAQSIAATCTSTFGSQCGTSGCASSWVPAYKPNFICCPYSSETWLAASDSGDIPCDNECPVGSPAYIPCPPPPPVPPTPPPPPCNVCSLECPKSDCCNMSTCEPADCCTACAANCPDYCWTNSDCGNTFPCTGETSNCT
ncbi:hypothetical protein DFJ74DRAFT_665701 [Hyaloraphidium curvatum]|nr:hypothetical protein DFJ74DRAFT_665701 [Hyaloraphidium curvatum]